MADFGKLNFSVSFDRTSAFPIEANSYFTNYKDAEAAAKIAVEVGSADSVYYIGEILTVVEGNTSKSYIIQPDKSLKEIIIDVDTALNNNSNNPVLNRIIKLAIDTKLDILESGINIKTINNESILNSGNIDVIPTIGTNKNWFLNGKDTGIRAEGVDGKDGAQGNSGVSGSVDNIEVVNNLNGGESTPDRIRVLAAELGKVLNEKHVTLTKDEYDSLPSKDEDKYYYIIEE